ncbi:hypothetical protein ACJ41O_013281 [Fusarium nematophilum]
MDGNAGFAAKVGRGVTHGILFAMRRWKHIMVCYVLVILLGSTLLYMNQNEEAAHLARRSWGGWDEHPVTEKCYRQERTAMLLSLFFGCLGVDQFYAHHWALAVFKLLTFGGFGVWALVDMILWIVGGVYGTPGCRGGNPKNGWSY